MYLSQWQTRQNSICSKENVAFYNLFQKKMIYSLIPKDINMLWLRLTISAPSISFLVKLSQYSAMSILISHVHTSSLVHLDRGFSDILASLAVMSSASDSDFTLALSTASDAWNTNCHHYTNMTKIIHPML